MFALSGSISLLFPLPFSQQIFPRLLLIETINGLRLHGHQRLGICPSQRIHLVHRLALASIGGHVAELLVDVSVDLVLRLVMSLHDVLALTGVLVWSSVIYYTPEPQSLSLQPTPSRQTASTGYEVEPEPQHLRAQH